VHDRTFLEKRGAKMLSEPWPLKSYQPPPYGKQFPLGGALVQLAFDLRNKLLAPTVDLVLGVEERAAFGVVLGPPALSSASDQPVSLPALLRLPPGQKLL